MQPNMSNLSIGRSTPNFVRSNSPRDRQSFQHSEIHYIKQLTTSPMDSKQNYSKVDFFPDKGISFGQPIIYSNPLYQQDTFYNVHSEMPYIQSPSLQYDDNYPRYSSLSSRASVETANWLLENYETAEGVSLPRCTLYSNYRGFCTESGHPPMNQASFGKLIRTVFPLLKTRRLGTRGHSKYHYYGIKIKMGSKLNRIRDELQTPQRLQAFKILTQPNYKNPFSKKVILFGKSGSNFLNENTAMTKRVSGVSTEMPPFVQIDVRKITVNINKLHELVNIFQNLYRKHCNEIKEAVNQFNFKLVPTLWTDFWGNFVKKRNSFENMIELVNSDEVVDYIFTSDCILYQHLVSLLIPDILEEAPSSQTQNIRMFSKSLEIKLSSALTSREFSERLVSKKINAVSGFGQTLRRYTKLQHLSQSTQEIFSDQSLLSGMCSDISKIDLGEIQDQMYWISNCKTDFVQKIQTDFITGLSQISKIDQWTTWLEEIVNIVLAPFTSEIDFQKAGEQLMLKWSAHLSIIIRDLTLRSCLTFGSFHLMKLFFDDYIQYLVEIKIAEIRKTTVIEFITENRQINLNNESDQGSLEIDQNI